VVTRKERQLRATAYHKAGHAVAAWHFGLQFKQVTIEPSANNETLGHVLHRRSTKWFNPDSDSGDRTRLRAERHIITSFVSQLAEGKIRRRPPRFGMEGDNKSALDMALHLCGSMKTADAYLNFCCLTSGDLVASHWSEIETVAAALLKRRTLNHEEMLEVIMQGTEALRMSIQGVLAKMKGSQLDQ
jgi:hypothetical protein